MKRIIKHRHFSKDVPYDFDVALLQLSRPAQLNVAVNTICLPQSHQHISPGTVCYITGLERHLFITMLCLFYYCLLLLLLPIVIANC